jgi:hypothetical protein
MEISTRKSFLGGKARPTRKAEPMRADPLHLTTLKASTACYWQSFSFLLSPNSFTISHAETAFKMLSH